MNKESIRALAGLLIVIGSISILVSLLIGLIVVNKYIAMCLGMICGGLFLDGMKLLK